MKSEEWAEIWELLCARFNREPHVGLATFYLEALEGVPLNDQQIREGVRRVLYADTYWPSPQRLVEAAQGPQEGTTELALEQWRKCQRIMSGSLDTTKTMDPIGQEVVTELGGTSALRRTSTDEVQYRRKEFLKLYKEIAEERSTTTREELPALTTEGRRLLGEFDGAVKEVPGER